MPGKFKQTEGSSDEKYKHRIYATTTRDFMSKHYGALRSRDMVNWEDVTAKMHFADEGTDVRMRHGTAIAIPKSLAVSLRASEGAQP